MRAHDPAFVAPLQGWAFVEDSRVGKSTLEKKGVGFRAKDLGK